MHKISSYLLCRLFIACSGMKEKRRYYTLNINVSFLDSKFEMFAKEFSTPAVLILDCFKKYTHKKTRMPYVPSFFFSSSFFACMECSGRAL